MKQTAQMMLVTQEWAEGIKTFKLIPLTQECNFLECRFHFERKQLILISRQSYRAFNMLPKLDENGEIIPLPGPKKGQIVKGAGKQIRIETESFYDYSITERSEIEFFVEALAGVSAYILDKFFIVPEPVKDSNLKAPIQETKSAD